MVRCAAASKALGESVAATPGARGDTTRPEGSRFSIDFERELCSDAVRVSRIQWTLVPNVARPHVKAAPHDRRHAIKRCPLELAILGARLMVARGADPDDDIGVHDRFAVLDVTRQLR